jgi:hypothetical protein
MLGRNSPLSTGSFDDIDKFVDLDAVNKITSLGAAHTPNKGYLLYRGSNEREAPPEDPAPASVSNRSDASFTSSEMNHTAKFATSADFHDEVEFGLGNESDGIIVNDCINNTAPISIGMPTVLDMADDMTSVAVSPNEPVDENVRLLPGKSPLSARWSKFEAKCECLLLRSNIVLFYYRVEPYKHNNYMVIDNHTEI